jgi:periplasmic copper chaperone A
MIFKKHSLFLLLAIWLVACQPTKISTGVLDIKNVWARPAANGDNGAVYFTMENGTAQDDVLNSVQTDIATAVELHMSVMEGDHMSMHQQDVVTIPAGGAVEFTPGGLHVMLVGLVRELKTGDTFDVTLEFENAGEKIVTVTVRDDVNDD